MLSLCVLNYCCMCKEAGGGGEGARDTESKTRTPHKDVGKKTRPVLAQTPKSLLRYVWMLEPVTFIALLGTGQMDVEKSEWQVER